MLKISLKLEFLQQPFLQSHQHIAVAGYGPATLPADQMVVTPLIRMVINEPSLQFTPDCKTKLLKKFEVPVDSRFVNIRGHSLHLVQDILGAEMAGGPVQDVQNQSPLRRKPVSLILEDGNATHCFCN